MALQRIGKPLHPLPVPIFQIFQNQVILAREMPIESDLGHTRLRDDPINARGPNPFSVKQVMGSHKDALPRWAVPSNLRFLD